MKRIFYLATLFTSILRLYAAHAGDERFEAQAFSLETAKITFVDGNLEVGICHAVVFDGSCLKTIGLSPKEFRDLIVDKSTDKRLIGYQTKVDLKSTVFNKSCNSITGDITTAHICLQAILEHSRP